MSLLGNIEEAIGFLSPEWKAQRLDNQIKRETLAEHSRVKPLKRELGSLLSQPAPSGLPGYADRTKENVTNLLGQIAPVEMATSLLSPDAQSRYAPTIKMFEDRYGPMSEEQMGNLIGLGGNGMDAQAELDLRISLMEFDELRKAQTEQRQSVVRSDAMRRAEIVSSLKDLRSMGDQLAILESSALRAGIPYNEFIRSIASGGDFISEQLGAEYDASAVLEAMDTFKKGTARFGAKTANRRFGSSPTNAQLAQVMEFTPSLKFETGANRNILADITSDLLTEAEIYGVEGIDYEGYRSYVEELRGGTILGVLSQIPGYRQMSSKDQAELRRRVARMSPEERRDLLRATE